MNSHDLRFFLADRADSVDTERHDRVSEVHVRIRTARRRRAATVAGAAVTAAALGLAAAWLSDGATNTQEPVDQPTARVSTLEPERDYTIVGETALVGPGRWAQPAIGTLVYTAPLAVFDVPAGWVARGETLWLQGPVDFGRNFANIRYWTPGRVPSASCLAPGWLPLAETVEDLAANLVAHEGTTTTDPVPVELDGHRGLYLELQTHTRACGTSNPTLIWENRGIGGGTRYYVDQPATIRFWIMDVEFFEPLVLAVTSYGKTNPEYVQRAVDVVEGVTFVDYSSSSE